MRVVFTTAGDGLEAAMDMRFGRAPGFLLYDTETRTTHFVDNRGAAAAAQGAGIQAAGTVSRLQADAIVTGHCGPKALKALRATKLSVYETDAGTVGQALAALEAGELNPLPSEPDHVL